MLHFTKLIKDKEKYKRNYVGKLIPNISDVKLLYACHQTPQQTQWRGL